MAKKRRNRRRRKGKKTVAKKEARVEKYLGISSKKDDRVNMVRLVLRKNPMCWPQKMRTIMKMVSSNIVGPQTAEVALSFYMNSFGDGTAATNGCGPQVNWTGAFAKNYPSGIKGMIQTPAPAGTAICPYQFYRIRRSKIFIDLVPAPIGASVTPSGEIRYVLVPSQQASFSGSSETALAEQPLAVYGAISNPIFGTSTTTAASGGGSLSGAERKRISVWGSVGRILGVPPSAIDNNDNYRGTYAASPASLAYFHLALLGDGGTYACNIETQIVYDVEFYGLNNLSSAQNN